MSWEGLGLWGAECRWNTSFPKWESNCQIPSLGAGWASSQGLSQSPWAPREEPARVLWLKPRIPLDHGNQADQTGGNSKCAGSMQVLLRLIRNKTVDCCTAHSTGTQQAPRDDFIDLFDKMGGFLVAQLSFQSQLLYNTECGGGGTRASHFHSCFGSLWIAVSSFPHPARAVKLNCSWVDGRALWTESWSKSERKVFLSKDIFWWLFWETFW